MLGGRGGLQLPGLLFAVLGPWGLEALVGVTTGDTGAL